LRWVRDLLQRSDTPHAGLKYGPSLQRGIWIGALIALIAGVAHYLRITMVENSEVVGPLRAVASEY
jgi:hypothetical protein